MVAAADKNQNINFIPNDLERKRQVIKKVIAQAPREYTEAQNGIKKTKPTLWSRLFTRKPKVKIDKTEPIKIIAVKPTHLPTLNKAEKETKEVERNAAGGPKPNFLIAAPMSAPPAPEVKNPPPPKAVEMTTVSDGGKKPAGSGDDFGVNLLAGEYAQAFAAQNQTSFFAYTVGGAAALIVVVYLGLYLYQTQTTGRVERSQAANTELESAIKSFSSVDSEDKLLGRKIGAIKELLAAHISTRAFLEKLEQVIIPEVTFKALAATPDGGVTVSARATSYTTLARQLTVLQAGTPWIKEVTVSSAGAVSGSQGEDEGVEFDMILRVDPNIFKAEQAK